MQKNAPIVAVTNLSKSFSEGGDNRRVLDGLDLTIERGELVVLLGRSGAGKSTLLNLVSGLDTPDRGSVVLGGTNLEALSERERTLFRRRHIGFVFQSFNLIPTLTVIENILLPLELNGGVQPEGLRRAAELLERVGLSDREATYPDRLSGGEQQRVAIARALVHEPLLVLADEPTGNLDYRTAKSVMEIYLDLIRENGTTMLIVTHDMDFLDHADRLLEMRDGKVATPDDGGRGPQA
ncbi:MAG: ABC transporter ATP-binding protein [Rhodothermales bacterium]|nr:ABC transporter ATP-binding protein [Rhodothermales bacterium]